MVSTKRSPNHDVVKQCAPQTRGDQRPYRDQRLAWGNEKLKVDLTLVLQRQHKATLAEKGGY